MPGLFASIQPASAQSSGRVWRDVSERSIAAAKTRRTSAANRTVVPQVYRTLQLDRSALETQLKSVPPEFGVPMEISSEFEIPLPDGKFARFHLQESPIMEPELAAKFPEIKTYVGQGIDDPTATMRMDLTPRGFHAIILSAEGQVYIDPYWRDDDSVYVSYFKKDFMADKPFRCLVETNTKSDRAELPSLQSATAERPSGASLRKYRLALACDGEYAVAVCSPNPPTLSATLAAIVTSVNRCSGIYERDLAIRFLLVANNDQIVFLDGDSDPYTNDDTALDENQGVIDSVIGSANYDIGHVFTTGAGGVAYLGVVCTGSKAGGTTGTSNPIGDPYDVDYVVHEMGHQFGADHTFNGTARSCGGGTRNAPTAYETDSGITIMAYAGICSTASVIQNLSDHSDDYFHTASYTEIDNFVSIGSGSTCPVTVATGNTPPMIGALTSNTIPVSTPFALSASASDPDGDTLTYCWEEYDKGTSQSGAAPSATSTTAPIFRSFPPTLSQTRTFPSLTYILNNANNPPAVIGQFATGEIMTTVARTMTYRVTVRDNHAGGGGSNWASTTVTTANAAAGAFAITSLNTATTIAGGSTQTITWNVASSDLAPVSCANVKISLSTDGGFTFPIVLANSVPNNGSANVTIPNTSNVATAQGRIKVEAVGNIFFDISNANLTITSTNSPPTLNLTSGITIVRGTPTPIVASVGNASSATNPLSVAVSDVPYGITITPAISGGAITLSGSADCRVVTTLDSRTYPITLTVTDGAGSTVSGSVNVVVKPNLTPSLGNYPNMSVASGGAITVSPAFGPSDANGNLPAAPFTVTPASVPGGGTVAINQATGAVTITTSNAATLGALPIRVSLGDSCGATTIQDFAIDVVPPSPSITSSPPPALVTVGTPYNFTFTASGSPAPTFALTSGTLPPGLSLSPEGILSGTATSAGNGSFPNLTVTASNGVPPNATQTFSLTAVTRAENYFAAYALTGNDALFTADPDFDGIPNLAEYGLSLNPNLANRSGLPVAAIKDYGGTNYLSLTFNRSSVATDLTYTVQATNDFVSWSDLATSTSGAATNGPGVVGETGSAPIFAVEVRDTVPVSTTPRFLRLRISTP